MTYARDICLVTSTLDRGGAQRQVAELAKQLTRGGIRVLVVAFYPEGALEEELRGAGVEVVSLAKRSRWDLAGPVFRLARLLRSSRPRILYSFLGTPNLVCLAVRPFVPRTRVVWGVRGSQRDVSAYDWVTRLVFVLDVALSRFVDVVIFNSEAGRRDYVSSGVPLSKLRVVPNGIDHEAFAMDPGSGLAVRRGWGIGSTALLVGLVGNFEPVKGHELFLEAAAIVAAKLPDARFVCVGNGSARRVESIRQYAKQLGIETLLTLAGEREDMAAVFNALDVAVSASESEGFSNTIAEAMACGTLCVVTDVGDSADVVGEAGVVVTQRTPQALAAAIAQGARDLEARGSELGQRARARIVELYSLDMLACATLDACGFTS